MKEITTHKDSSAARMDRRTFLRRGAAAGLLAPLGLAGLSQANARAAGLDHALTLDHAAWSYDATNDVYYQLGKVYVTHPADETYENLGIYVPGAYFSATLNSDGTYTATVKPHGKVGKFTASTAPVVFPVNTPGYAAQAPPTSYSYDDCSDYVEAGFVFVFAGLRGRDSSTTTRSDDAPWGVTDLKAALRYVRFNAARIPGNPERAVMFGLSGGGAQSSIAGASGDSSLYTPYLKSLGAAMTMRDGTAISDAIAGVMAWCPITSLDYASASYEWNMGQFASSGTREEGTWTRAYSRGLSRAWAEYQNKLGLIDPSGKTLALKRSARGIYLAGSYYTYLLSVITTSLNDFLGVTSFPYTLSSSTGGGMGGTSGGSGAPPSGGTPPSGTTTTSSSGTTTTGTTTTSSSSSETFDTVEDYISYLNTDSTWVRYDSRTKQATVLNLDGFVTSQKPATKDVGAFDGISRQETENYVHGIDTSPLHFSGVCREVIAANQVDYAKYSDWSSSYRASEYTSDFRRKDTIGSDTEQRVDMFNPMFFLSSYYKGFLSSNVAPHWRIRTGIMQGDTANTTEVNLALALQNYGSTKVDFATIWGQGHEEAELTGNPTSNFIRWVENSFKG